MSETTKCPNPDCGAMSPSNAAFCSKCGTKLTSRCPNPQCGAVLRGGENFCAKCGTPLTAAPAARGAVEQAQTTMTEPSKVKLYLFPTDRGGRHTPVFPGYRPELVPKGSKQRFKVLVDGYEQLWPGQSSTVNVRLLDNASYTLRKGDQFTILEDGSADLRELVELAKLENPDADLAALGLDGDGLHFVGEVEIL